VLINTSVTAATCSGNFASGSYTGRSRRHQPERSGSGGTLIKINSGTLTLGGTADNTGLILTVNSGTAQLAKASSSVVHAVNGLMTIAANAVVKLGGSGNFQNAGNLTLNGTLDLNGQNDSVLLFSGARPAPLWTMARPQARQLSPSSTPALPVLMPA